VAGVRAATPDGPPEVRADLVVDADGHRSAVREKAGLEARDRRAWPGSGSAPSTCCGGKAC
jgi:2-polyprenyl-6-methoxyphenol hydroxylase-like FAD-dependent oxidoreductase